MSKKTSKSHLAAQKPTHTTLGLGADLDNNSPAAPDGPSRPPRIPMGAGMNLAFPEELLERDKYAYRFFAENTIKMGRIEQAKGAYWELVTNPQGSNIIRPSGMDSMYLMRLPIQYWEEDQEKKRLKNRAMMVKEAALDKGEYAPTPEGHAEGGKTAITHNH